MILLFSNATKPLAELQCLQYRQLADTGGDHCFLAMGASTFTKFFVRQLRLMCNLCLSSSRNSQPSTSPCPTVPG